MAGGGTLSESPLLGEVAASLAPGDRVDGLYRVERLLGQGGGGAVYLVRHEGLDGARFALKVLHRHAGQSGDLLAREGRLAAGVRSAHVVKVAALGHLPGGAPYLVMEYVDGPTLEAMLSLRELSPREALDCGHQLCLALEAAHEAYLVHGDVSLRNIFVTPQADGTLHLQLADFGLARRARGSARDTTGTVSVELGSGRGTPRFMAPEAIAGDGVDARSDLFSAGVVLYRLAGGAFPFDGATAREILAAVLRGTPPPLGTARNVPRALEALVMRCLASDPTQRFESASALRAALQAVIDAGPEPPARLWSRRRGLRLSVGAGVTAAVLLGFVAFGQWRVRARIPLDAALACPDTAVPDGDDPKWGRAVARALCARVGAGVDVDWGGGEGATQVLSRLRADPEGAWLLDVDVAGRRVTVSGQTPRAVALEAAHRVLERAERSPPDAVEIRRWGAGNPETASAMRAVFRRRTSLVYSDIEAEARALVAQDPGLPFAHLILAEVSRDPDRQAAARAAVATHADRLPPERAAAARAFVAALAAPEAADDALEALRRAYGASPGDPDVAVLYTGALVNAGRGETARAVAERVQTRFPRRVALASHYASLLPENTPDANARFVEALVEALPDQVGSTANICQLTGLGQLDRADAALDFARRFGVGEEGLALPAAVAALASGDPARIERATATHEGSTGSWSQLVGARLRLVGLLHRGQLAAAATFAHTQMAARRAAGDAASEMHYATERLRLSRLTPRGPTLSAAELDRMESALSQEELPLPLFTSAQTELALARLRAGSGGELGSARADLARLDAEITRRAGADSLARAAARLRTLPLAQATLGDAEAAQRWRDGAPAWLSDRVRAAYDAALALEASGDLLAAEAAYQLAASPYDLDRHPFEAVAARVRLAVRLDATGRAEEARALRAHVDLAWSGADAAAREIARLGR